MPTYVTHDEGIINVAKIDFESQTSVEIDADTGGISIDGTDNSNFSLTANNGSNKTLAIKSVNTGGGDGLIDIECDGILELNSSGGVISIGNDAIAQNINVGTGAAARTITVGNVTGATALALNSGTGGVAVASTGAGDITINSDDTLLLDSDGILELNSSGGVISIGNDDIDQAINIGTQGERTVSISTGSFASTVNIGNATGATTLALTSGTGGVALSSTDTGTDAIQLNASAGGVDIDAAAAKDVHIAGGQVALVSKDNAASAISLTANVGTTETIVVTNTKGTSESAITLASSAGGVDIDAAAAKDVNIAGGQVALISKDNAASAISLTANVGTTETIVVTNTKGSGAGAITLNAAAGGITIDASGDITLASSKINGTASASSPGDNVLYVASGVIKKARLQDICFLEGTKITLPDKKQINIEDLTLDDKVVTYNIDELSELKDKTKISSWQTDAMKGTLSESGIRNIWINPTESYLVINNKLRVTNHHLIHFKRDNYYYFNFVEQLILGDELLTDEEIYEPIISIEEVKENINVYNFELDKDQTYFADNYLVHHYCKLCSGYSNII